jgi:hypothetical protein
MTISLTLPGAAAMATCAPLHKGNALVASELQRKEKKGKMVSKMCSNNICNE